MSAILVAGCGAGVAVPALGAYVVVGLLALPLVLAITCRDHWPIWRR